MKRKTLAAAHDAALKDLRPHLPPVSSRSDLGFSGAYSGDDFRRIVSGFRSSSMDEKWNIIYETPWLYFYRSWTGVGCYGVRLEPTGPGAIVSEAWVNSDVHGCDK